MIEHLASHISWVFVLTTLFAVGIYLHAANAASRSSLGMTTLVLAVLLAVHAVLALNGFYLATTTPPRFPLAPFPTIIVLLIVFYRFARGGVSVKALQLFTLLSIVRIPVELVLLWLYQHGEVPRLMTFEGRNFDILSGISAPVVAWLAFRGGAVHRPLLIGWHVLAFALLVNIMTNAILSLETPIQQFAFDQPNRGVLYFPFIWLPAVIVPLVFVSHVVSLRQLLTRCATTHESPPLTG